MRELWSRLLKKVGHGKVMYGTCAASLVCVVLMHGTDIPDTWLTFAIMVFLLIMVATNVDAGIE
ncbi:MAG: hypothetical protein ACE5EX_09890 [Phycisphaerae bacterium]